MTRPSYPHDCTACVFLGEVNYVERHDLYYCPQGGMDTVIDRFGARPEDYRSSLAIARLELLEGRDTPLSIALRRAIQSGLVPPTEPGRAAG